MKPLIDTLTAHRILCPKLHPVSVRELGSRKRIDLYLGVDAKGYYCSVMHLNKKSRVLSKEAAELMALHARLETLQDTSIRKRYIWVEAPLCSKAQGLMEAEGWKFL